MSSGKPIGPLGSIHGQGVHVKREDVWDLYDAGYAEAYDERFLLAPWPKAGLDFEVDALRPFVERPGATWLDAGCGTGHVLSLFPGVDRAGLDLSPAMLEQAAAANEDVRELRQGDFREDIEEWHGAWDVVSCMWSAYQYVESMPEIDTVFGNLARWVAPGGTLFVPLSDLEDLRYVDIPYEADPDVWYGTIALTGVTWSWTEDTGKFHRHLVAPQAGHVVRLLEPHFEKVEVLRYPPFFPGGISRKAVLATGRRPIGEDGTATVVWHPVPKHPDEVEAQRTAEAQAQAQVEAEARRAAAAADREGELLRQIDRDAHELEYLRGEVHRQHALLHEAEVRAAAGSAERPAPPTGDPSGISTRRLVGEVARRANPLQPGFARRVVRKLRR